MAVKTAIEEPTVTKTVAPQENTAKVIKAMDILQNVSKRELVNIKNASEKVDEYIGKDLEVKGLAIILDNVTNKETGEIENKQVVSFILTDGHIISSPSATLVRFGESLVDVFEDEDNKPLTIQLVTRKSNNGRNFYTGLLK